MLHAGAVADPASGRALAYVAPGGTGKSTLTRLLAQTLGYVTDETVGVVPATLEVLPYPKPLTWADEKGKPKREHAPEDVGLGATPERVKLARLAVLRRRDGAEATFTPLGLLDAVEMVVPETSSLSKLNLPLEVFADVYEQVGGVTLIEYGEAEDVVEWCVQSLVDSGAGSAAAAPSIRSFVPHENSGQRLRRPLARNPAGERSGNETLSERAEVLVAGEESAVLVGDELLRLGPIATAIIELLPCSVEELAAALEERFGAPADGNLIPAVEEQLRTLAEHGVVERGN
ncbi:PqqD family protein [Tessaracoccus massiliensis]|uniref:PqqD family protein n=1 Tax=Tessaracoccus massiliensis TaxID=1522311 RepID=UPI0006933669|nr:PqqD family protein [Tessaracoccus massiliensis]